MSALGTLYAKHVCLGKRTYPDDIPEKYRAEVKEICLKSCPEKVN